MKTKASERGFSYIDVMIAVVIMLVGVVTLVGTLTAALSRVNESEQELNAKQFASSAIESVFTARDIADANAGAGASNPLWANIQNAPAGIFLAGPQPVMSDPGNDAIFGTADDTGTAAAGFQRTIDITDVPNALLPSRPISMRQVTVTVTYKIGRFDRQVTLTTYVGNY